MGLLIDGRYRISLGRLQLLSWTLLILSAIIAAAFNNISLGIESPIGINIPSQLWVLMGITIASAVSAPAVLSNKRHLKPDKDGLERTVSIREKQTDKTLNINKNDDKTDEINKMETAKK